MFLNSSRWGYRSPLSASRYSWHRFQLKRRSTIFVRAPVSLQRLLTFFDGNAVEHATRIVRSTQSTRRSKVSTLQPKADLGLIDMAEEEEYAPVLQQRGSPKSRDRHWRRRRSEFFCGCISLCARATRDACKGQSRALRTPPGQRWRVGRNV